MTDQETLNVEATKLVKEWSVWMVAVQSGLIAFLANSPANASLALPMQIALGSFAVSILAAAWVLSALPYILIRLLENEDPNIFFMSLSSAPLLKYIPLWLMGAIQHLAFAIGLISLIAGRLI